MNQSQDTFLDLFNFSLKRAFFWKVVKEIPLPIKEMRKRVVLSFFNSEMSRPPSFYLNKPLFIDNIFKNLSEIRESNVSQCNEVADEILPVKVN
jgi:hypothetical protein